MKIYQLILLPLFLLASCAQQHTEKVNELTSKPVVSNSEKVTAKKNKVKPAVKKQLAPIERAKPYPFNGCIVTNQKFGMFGPKHTKIYDGQVVKFCCTPCVAIFENNKAIYMQKIMDAQKNER